MIKLYEIRVRISFNNENTEESDPLGEVKDSEKTEEMKDAIAMFHVGSTDLFSASLEASDKAKKMFKDDYEIVSVSEMLGIFISNWPEEPCPYYDAFEAAPEDILEFTCSCGNILKVTDGWKQLECRFCDKIIDRNQVIGSGGKYLLVESKKEGKESSS